MDDFYAARSRTIPPLPWSNFAPPISVLKLVDEGRSYRWIARDLCLSKTLSSISSNETEQIMKNDENPEIPNGIGPHKGREFALMRENKKNVALFFEIEPDGLNKILQEGYCLLQFRQFVHLG